MIEFGEIYRKTLHSFQPPHQQGGVSGDWRLWRLFGEKKSAKSGRLSIMTEPEFIEAEAGFLEQMADALRRRAQELRELGQGDQDTVHESLVKQLEALAWTPARSGKCDFAKTEGLPKELVESVPVKGGLKGVEHHFTKSTDGSVLFRFKRNTGAKP